MPSMPTPVGPVRPLRGAVLAAALLAGSTAAWSIDLLQAFEAARRQDATILAARAAAEAGRERLPQAQAQLLPNISAALTNSYNQLTTTTALEVIGRDRTTSSSYPSSSQTVTLRQPLFRTFLMSQYRQAKAQVEGTDAILQQDEQDLAVRVCTAYFEAVLTNEQLALVLAQRAAVTTQLDSSRKSFAAGSGTRTDIDEAQARLDMTLAQEIEARQNIDYTMRQLHILVNEPLGRLAILDVPKLELRDPQPNRLDDWVDRAERQNAQLQSLKAQIEVARQEVEKANAGHHPTLDGILQWARNNNDNITNANSRYENTLIGVQLNIPIYAGGAVNSSIREALARLDQAQQALEGGRRDLGARVHREFRAITESVHKVRALEQALRSADQLIVSSRRSYQAGNRTVVDVLNAEQQQVAVLRDLAQSRYIYMLSQIRLLALVGAADVEAIMAMNRLLK